MMTDEKDEILGTAFKCAYKNSNLAYINETELVTSIIRNTRVDLSSEIDSDPLLMLNRSLKILLEELKKTNHHVLISLKNPKS